ncbi:hypothetical protein D3C85_1294530 [compost metagenome]
MVMAVRGVPVKFTPISPMDSSKSVPASTFGCPWLVMAHTGLRHSPKPASTPPAAKAFTKVRLDVLECMEGYPVSQSPGRYGTTARVRPGCASGMRCQPLSSAQDAT